MLTRTASDPIFRDPAVDSIHAALDALGSPGGGPSHIRRKTGNLCSLYNPGMTVVMQETGTVGYRRAHPLKQCHVQHQQDQPRL